MFYIFLFAILTTVKAGDQLCPRDITLSIDYDAQQIPPTNNEEPLQVIKFKIRKYTDCWV